MTNATFTEAIRAERSRYWDDGWDAAIQAVAEKLEDRWPELAAILGDHPSIELVGEAVEGLILGVRTTLPDQTARNAEVAGGVVG